jgi:hypothetical protein
VRREGGKRKKEGGRREEDNDREGGGKGRIPERSGFYWYPCY